MTFELTMHWIQYSAQLASLCHDLQLLPSDTNHPSSFRLKNQPVLLTIMPYSNNRTWQ